MALELLGASPPAGDGASSSILHEGRLLARVRHPNVVTIYGAEQIGARIGLWMEFVRGRTLKQIVDDGQVFSGAEAVQLGIDAAHAVAVVHSAGVLHRDIKAQNVMLADDGRAVLMDFGTGPVRGRSLGDVRLAHQRNERISIRTARGHSDLPPKLARIIERAIDPRPVGRYASADAMAADLETLQRRPAPARRPYAIAVATVLLFIAGVGGNRLAGASDLREHPARCSLACLDRTLALPGIPFRTRSRRVDPQDGAATESTGSPTPGAAAL